MEIIFWIFLGIFIGWSTTEPLWAINLKENIKQYLRGNVKW